MVSFTTFMAVAVHFNANHAFDLATYASIVLTLPRDISVGQTFPTGSSSGPTAPVAQTGARHLDDVGYRIDLSRHSPAPITAGGTFSTRIHGDMQKVEQGVLPLCPRPLPAHVLSMPGAGAHH